MHNAHGQKTQILNVSIHSHHHITTLYNHEMDFFGLGPRKITSSAVEMAAKSTFLVVAEVAAGHKSVNIIIATTTLQDKIAFHKNNKRSNNVTTRNNNNGKMHFPLIIIVIQRFFRRKKTKMLPERVQFMYIQRRRTHLCTWDILYVMVYLTEGENLV